MTDENDTLDFLWTKPLSSVESELRGDLQRVSDELRELLMAFNETRTTGARTIRVARIDEPRVYALYEFLAEVKANHRLADR